jgi:RNA polymerase sigma-70 factor (ECF subfamily)
MTFDEVYELHFDFVWKSLRRLGVPSSDVPDVAQEVFVVVHRRLSSFEARAKVTTWLFQICLHAARDRNRRAHVRREVADTTSLEALPAHGERADQLLEHRDDLEMFDAVLDGMNSEQRAVFVMFELSEMTGDDIAATLGVPLGTVYSRIRLAREAFRRGAARVMAVSTRRLLAREGSR